MRTPRALIRFALPALVLSLGLGVQQAQARLLCDLVLDAQGARPLSQRGEACDARATPASTFKLALAAMGFDAGLLQGPHAPILSWKPGDPAWGGEAWKEDADPERWLRLSVVWYSQRIAHALGAERLAEYARAFGYGNADFSGDPGMGNGLDRAWIASSLTISPQEQARFLAQLLAGELPISAEATRRTMAVTPVRWAEGWRIAGKTGGAAPRLPGGGFDRARGWGWFVGWAEKDGRRLIFVRLTQGEGRPGRSPGLVARDAFLDDWPARAASLPLR